MEEEWVKVAKLDSVNSLKTDEYRIKQIKKYWDDILKDENIDYKYEIEQEMKYEGFDPIKGINRTLYSVYLYVKKADRKRIENIIYEINKEEKKQQDNQKEKEEIKKQYEGLTQVKLLKIFISVLISIIILIEIVILVEEQSLPIAIYIIFSIAILLELITIGIVWKKRRKRK